MMTHFSFLDDIFILLLDLIGMAGTLKALRRSDSRSTSYGCYIFIWLYFVFSFTYDVTYLLDPSVVEYRQLRIATVRILMVAAAWYGALTRREGGFRNDFDKWSEDNGLDNDGQTKER